MTKRKQDGEFVEPLPPQNDPRLLLTVQAVALRLSIGRSFAYQLIMSGEIASIKLGSRRLIPSTALDAFIKAQMDKEEFDSHFDSHGGEQP